MQESLVNGRPRRGLIRRVGAAGLSLAALLALGACRAEGGGYIGAPLPSGSAGVFNGDADFGFNFTCRMDQQQNRAVIRGTVTYHDRAASSITIPGDPAATSFPEIRIHGTVDPFFVKDVATCEQAAEAIPDAAQFEGTYRPQDRTAGIPGQPRDGRFVIQVFDQGEPARPGGDFTGDSFAIELLGGAYGAYTRGGYIEGGNIQVRG